MPSALNRYSIGEVYQTTIPATCPPPSINDYDVLPYGNCSPKVIRMSMYNIPTTNSLLQTSKIPLGGVFTPLAQPIPKEQDVPCVDFGESDPPRCLECMAYVNPCVTWIDNGRLWICPICDNKNQGKKNSNSELNPSKMD